MDEEQLEHQLKSDLHHITMAVEVALAKGLLTEVIHSALNSARKYPELNNTTHMGIGLSEWVK